MPSSPLGPTVIHRTPIILSLRHITMPPKPKAKTRVIELIRFRQLQRFVLVLRAPDASAQLGLSQRDISGILEKIDEVPAVLAAAAEIAPLADDDDPASPDEERFPEKWVEAKSRSFATTWTSLKKWAAEHAQRKKRDTKGKEVSEAGKEGDQGEGGNVVEEEADAEPDVSKALSELSLQSHSHLDGKSTKSTESTWSTESAESADDSHWMPSSSASITHDTPRRLQQLTEQQRGGQQLAEALERKKTIFKAWYRDYAARHNARVREERKKREERMETEERIEREEKEERRKKLWD